MKSRPASAFSKPASTRARCAFSLIEVLVVTGLLSVIILGLVLMFSQTQRAYKLGTTQVDVLEGGRMVTDLMSRDLSQITPANGVDAINFLLEQTPPPRIDAAFTPQEFYQDLPGSTGKRINRTQHLFFLTRENQSWTAIGYLVGGTNAGIGTLYRYTRPADPRYFPIQHTFNFDTEARALYRFNTPSTNMSRLLDGVVHFRCSVFDPAGVLITNNFPMQNAFLELDELLPDARGRFFSNAVPATVEIELGVLESREIERARSISDTTARANFLAQQAGKVHIFRWRVPVRNFDPAAYQ